MKREKAYKLARRACVLFQEYIRVRHPMLAGTEEAQSMADEYHNACFDSLLEEGE